MEQNTKNHPKSKIVRTVYCKCTYVTIKAVLIIFAVVLQTITNIIMSSVAGKGEITRPTSRTAKISHPILV